MKQVKLLVSIILVGIGVALTYHIFENAVHGSITAIWYTWLNTDANRLLVIPIGLVFALTFFGLQHWLDRPSEDTTEHGLGNMPKPTVTNYAKVLFIGFFSLLAGASLGPEAILVPASMILGAYVGTKLFKADSQPVKLLAAAGIMALFTAFFHSFLIGVLSVLLVVKQAKVKLKPQLLLVAVLASGTSLVTLNLLSSDSYFQLPSYTWQLNIETLLLGIVLAASGFIVTHGMYRLSKSIHKLREPIQNSGWVIWAIVASIGLSIIYLLGGPLTEFTGNKSIVPMFEQAASLGIIGLLKVLAIKVIAISWSKAIGYRGGMIFPTVFVAAVLVAIVQLYVANFNLIYGLIAVLIGAFASNKKTHVLV